jgi:hypothetical protein
VPAQAADHTSHLDPEILQIITLELVNLSTSNKSLSDDERGIRVRYHGDVRDLSRGRIATELLQMRQERIREWARMAYEKTCEVLGKAGQRNSPDSIRAIFTDVIAMGISARVSATQAEMKDWARSNNYSGPLESHLFGFRFEVGQQKAWWLRKLESEAKQCELAARMALGSEHQVADKVQASTESLSNAKILGIRRAKLVARLIKELNALRPHLQIPEEDFPRLRKQHPRYQVFKICKEHPGAAKWINLVCERRRVESLAWELAAIECGVSPATVKTAWKRYKPKPSSPE